MIKSLTVFLMMLLSGFITIGVSGQDDQLQIVASHSILADVVSNIVGDAADVTSTLPVGADPHAYEPLPSDLTALADADVVFINGAFFEEGLMEAIENASTEMNLVTVSSCVEMIEFGDHAHDDEHQEGVNHADDDHNNDDHEENDVSLTGEACEDHEAEIEALHEVAGRHSNEEVDNHDDDEHDHGETLGRYYVSGCAEEHGYEDEEHSDEDGHNHEEGDCDPHVWMDPHNVMLWTMLIRDTVSAMDPINAELYTENAATYIQELDTLVHDFMEPMIETIPEENRVLVTNHDSLGYFAVRYNFEIFTTVIPGSNTASEPSASDIAEIIDIIREESVSAIFGETTVNDSIVQIIASETGADVFILYSGSLSDNDEPAATYLDYMRYNVTTIIEALGGGV